MSVVGSAGEVDPWLEVPKFRYRDLMIVPRAVADVVLAEAAWWLEHDGVPGQGHEIVVRDFTAEEDGEKTAQTYADLCMRGLRARDADEAPYHRVTGHGELSVRDAVYWAFRSGGGQVVLGLMGQHRDDIYEPFLTRIAATLHEQGGPTDSLGTIPHYI